MSGEITIDLLKSENARSFLEGNIIHITEFLTVINHINDLIDLAKTDESKENLHKAITVLGSRGSGKTSFLLNAKKYYETNNEVSVLPIIDPTLIEEKGHVFLNVLSAISEAITKKLDDDVFNLEYNQQIKRQWHNKLMNLAHGIPSIDGIGSNNSDNWMDPEFVMDTGLAAVSASRNLMQNFNDLLDFSAQILKKNVFLLIFDDIDVDSSKGWAVLECIRKYFTSSKLIILLSGDMNLYSTVIRQKKWMNFGREILTYEGIEQGTGYNSKKINRFNDMVVELSSQYMLKIMPPKYRIHLTTISEKKRISRDISINVSHPALEKEESLDKVYNRILKKFGIVNPTQQEVYRTFLLSLPLRTQIQFLIKNIDDKNRDYNSIIDIFLGELQEKNVDTYTSKHSSKFINTIILDLLISNHRLLDVYQLQPITTDSNLNACLFSLNILLSSSINSKKNGKYLLFDYFIRIGYIRNILSIIPYATSNSSSNIVSPTIEDLCDKSGIYTDRVLRDITANLQSYIFGAINNPATQNTNHYIKLMGLEEIAKKGFTDRLDSVFSPVKTKSLLDKTIAYIPSFISSYSHRQATQVSYSIHILLATIGEILKRDQLIAADKIEHERMKEVVSALLNLSQMRAYPAPIFDRRNSVILQNDSVNDNPSLFDFLSDDFSDKGELDNFAEDILSWISSYEKIANPAEIPSHLLGKIYTRFYFALENINRDFNKSILLGEIFNYQIISFFNAIIVEDTLEQLQNTPKLSMDNTKLSSQLFLQNLKKLNSLPSEQKNCLSLSKWLLSCPLLTCYLDYSDNELVFRLVDYTGQNLENAMRISVYNQLNLVQISNSDAVKNAADIYQVFMEGDSTLANRGREKDLIKILKENDYPRKWFEDKGKPTNTQHNKQISTYLYTIFGKKDNSGKIRNFRRFLELNPSLWP
ncbi:P-loop NTPase fold protein [Chryseobacterium hagamense]|uniref:KAP NTPase domain-containing protein n=1 Tax=Chryseobacterium hagamense TaxID=395935 RepID=A0A511YQP2_9FLAO|nr:P-loop NTPase fold protein [Chryseobacterium hagamense]GEN77511.1 hypothetical protein CHA01nite_32510 [Chryseobacterium hagamense]